MRLARCNWLYRKITKPMIHSRHSWLPRWVPNPGQRYLSPIKYEQNGNNWSEVLTMQSRSTFPLLKALQVT